MDENKDEHFVIHDEEELKEISTLEDDLKESKAVSTKGVKITELENIIKEFHITIKKQEIKIRRLTNELNRARETNADLEDQIQFITH